MSNQERPEAMQTAVVELIESYKAMVRPAMTRVTALTLEANAFRVMLAKLDQAFFEVEIGGDDPEFNLWLKRRESYASILAELAKLAESINAQVIECTGATIAVLEVSEQPPDFIDSFRKLKEISEKVHLQFDPEFVSFPDIIREREQ